MSCGPGSCKWGGNGPAWYSYDMIDNGRAPSAERIIPGLQVLQVGDLVPEGPEVGWTVRALEPDHLLLLDTHGPMKGVDWAQRGTWSHQDLVSRHRQYGP